MTEDKGKVSFYKYIYSENCKIIINSRKSENIEEEREKFYQKIADIIYRHFCESNGQ